MNNTNHNKPPVMGIASGLDPVSGEHGGRLIMVRVVHACSTSDAAILAIHSFLPRYFSTHGHSLTASA
jgi:hypothetical protein